MPVAIDKPSKYFTTTVYTGNGSTLSITGLEFSPDWVWIKNRNIVSNHVLFDTVRGTTLSLESESTSAEVVRSGITSFNSDGFTLGSNGNSNANGNSHASWSWRGSDSSAVSNTAGSISSTVSANTTSGFSIVSYTGNQTTLQTVGHGLGVAPKMIIIKNRTASGDAWMVYHASLGVSSGTIQRFLQLNNTNAVNNGGAGDFPTAPTSTVFGIGNFETMNRSGNSFIAYCFAEVKGFSKFGSYTGNGSSDGTFIYTGFTPAFVIFKSSSLGTTNWQLLDNKRNTFNPQNNHLRPNGSGAEFTNYPVDFLSNGFKFRNTDGDNNQSGETYIYMCFASNPFVSSKGIAVTAR